MRTFFRCYSIFSHWPYKVIVFGVLPVLAVGMEALGAIVNMMLFSLHFVAVTLVMIVGDSWVLNGICTKKSISLDFVKSAPKGNQVMKTAILADFIMRFVPCLFIFGVGGLISHAVLEYLVFGCASYLISTIGITICRHVDSIQMIMVVASLMTSLTSILVFPIWTLMLWWNAGFVLAIGVLLAVLCAVIAYFYTMKRVEGAYYD